MAHLKQKQISDNSCKSIIIDTLLDAVRPLTRTELSDEITSLFHVFISTERLNQLTKMLSDDGTIFFDVNDHIKIVPTEKPDLIIARLQEENIRKEATLLWIEYLRSAQEISKELETCLFQALPIFLRSLFVRHGVSSYEFLTATDDRTTFDLKQIATNVSQQFDKMYRDNIEGLLPTIFQSLHEVKIVEYLKHSIEKAVGYISEVISDENMIQITNALKSLTVYLDTNTIYRLLNLQGNSRYEAIKETLDFCRSNGVKLKISALTKKELSARLKYDAKVLIQYPTKTNLAQAGYKYRTSDNYVSTYWLHAQATKVSVDDFVAYYQNFDVLLEAEEIEIEEIEVDEEALIDKVKDFFGKMSLRDPLHEKSDSSLWHDAYNFAYVQKMQKADAKNAIDTQFLFLTTDQALTSFQREDHEAKECPPVVIAPSQLLQMFAFTKADSGYEETFIKFFASSSLGVSFKYDNNAIQEILSRIGHYQGVNAETAERILARELVSSRYFTAATDEEKEEVIYNSISEELLFELDLTKDQISTLESERNRLDEDCKAALDLLTENEQEFIKEKLRLQTEAAKVSHQRDTEAAARVQAEADSKNSKKYSIAQEELYVNEKMRKWEKVHRCIFWLGIILSGAVVILSLFLWMYLNDSGCLSMLGALAITIVPMTIGSKVFLNDAKLKARQGILDDYHEKLKKYNNL